MDRKKYIDLFCQIFHKNELEELRPYWCQGIKSKISIHSMELLATSIIYTLEKMRVKNFNEYFNITKETPFFDSGYKGIELYDENGGKFLIIVNEGSYECGLEDMIIQSIKIRGREISLSHGKRIFGDCGLHEDDFEKNVEIISNSLQLAFIGKH